MPSTRSYHCTDQKSDALVKFGVSYVKNAGGCSGVSDSIRTAARPLRRPGGQGLVIADQPGVARPAPPCLCGPGMGNGDAGRRARCDGSGACPGTRSARRAPGGCGGMDLRHRGLLPCGVDQGRRMAARRGRSRRCAHPIASAVGGDWCAVSRPASSRGKAMRKVAPCPGALSAQGRPPCSSTMRRALASPSPGCVRIQTRAGGEGRILVA